MNKKTVLAALVAFSITFTLRAQDTTARPAQDTTTRPRSSGGFFGKVLDAITKPAGGGTLGGLSSSDIAAGLKEALRVGISKGADQSCCGGNGQRASLENRHAVLRTGATEQTASGSEV